MKLTILTQYYPPEHGAPQNRLHDLAVRLKDSGVETTVLTAMPNYPKGELFPEYRGKFICDEDIDGIRVVRSWIFATRKKGTLFQLLSYFSFVKSSAIVGLFKLSKADFLICESPPLFLGLTALFLSFATRSRLVMNISDLWPESAVQLGILKPGIALSMLEWFEKLLYRKSVFVSCQTDGIVNGVLKRCPDAETFLLANGVALDFFERKGKDAKFAEENGFPKNALIVGYAGNHGRSQALKQILDAAEILSGKNIFFALFGDGPEKDQLVLDASRRDLKNVGFFPSRKRDEMAFVLSQFDLAVVPLKNIELFDGARPSKMFELMACAVPFIFCGRGEGAEIALASGGAEIVGPEEGVALAEKIAKFAEFSHEKRREMGKAARNFVENNFNRSRIAQGFLMKLRGR